MDQDQDQKWQKEKHSHSVCTKLRPFFHYERLFAEEMAVFTENLPGWAGIGLIIGNIALAYTKAFRFYEKDTFPHHFHSARGDRLRAG